MVVASYTTTGQNYNVVLSTEGQALDCNCKAGQYGKNCRHRDVATAIARQEVAKAERFLALKERFDYRSQSVRDARRAAYTALYNPCSID